MSRASTTSTGSPAPDWSASTGKALTSTLAHVLVKQGVLDYDSPVTTWWPEFGTHGKEGTTLRHVLAHTAGVPAVPADTTVEQLSDWTAMCAVIADSVPWWKPDEQVGYHAITYGFIIGEIVRRATGQPISRVLADRVTGPLGIADELLSNGSMTWSAPRSGDQRCRPVVRPALSVSSRTIGLAD